MLHIIKAVLTASQPLFSADRGQVSPETIAKNKWTKGRT
jgi:hypothetical protein